MEEEQQEEKPNELVIATVSALRDLPILSRLEFAKNMILERGGDRHSWPQDPVLIVVNDVLAEAIEALKKNPLAAQLRTPAPQ